MITVRLACAAVTLAAALQAQVAQTNQLVGWTNSPLLPSSGQVAMQDVDGGCSPAKSLCVALLHNTLSYAGGTAYDPRHQAAWISDGRALELRDLVSCNVLCTTTPHIMDPAAVVSGLAVSDHRKLLYQLETRPGYLGILPYFNDTCPPTPTRGGCTMALGQQEVAAGLCYDEVRDLLYFTTTQPGFAGSVHTLFVVSATDRCNPICKVLLQDCTPLNFRELTGLAYDACSQILYATTGLDTQRWKIVDPFACKLQFLDCCQKQGGGGAWAGLAVVPGWIGARFGSSCTDSFCPTCPGMSADLQGGDPSLGNGDFAIGLSGAPARNSGYLLLGPGGCHKGIQYPFMCSALHVPLGPATVAVGPIYLGTGPGCTGQAVVPLPIPVVPSLCGVPFCGQWGVLCLGTKVGLGISNAVHFKVASS